MKDIVDNPFKGATMIKHKGSNKDSHQKINISRKSFKILLEILPILLMIILILVIKNDYNLALIYLAIIVVSLLIKYEKNDFTILIFGLIIMTIFEFIFISTGVETFIRNSLLNKMPIWLPVLWAYGFVVIKRSVGVLNE